MSDELVELADSHRRPPDDARRVGDVDPAERLTVSVYVRRDPAASRIVDPLAQARALPGGRRYLTPSEVVTSFGAASADLEAVVEYAHTKGLETSDVSPVKRSVKIAGPLHALAAAFEVTLAHFQHGGVTFRGQQGAVRVPSSLSGVVEAVLGFDNRPLGRSYLRSHAGGGVTLPVSSAAGQQLPPDNYYPPQVGVLYDFPDAYDGAGQTVAVFVFNGTLGSRTRAPGGYKAALLGEYFDKVLDMKVPEIADVVVMGPGNDPGDGSTPYDVSSEVYLDLCMVGSLAPGAKIAVYFTEFTEQGWVDAISQAATDAATDPSVLSISYGNPESGAASAWSAMAVKQVNQAFEAAASAGRTICCAAGDSGATDDAGKGPLHVDFPASSPWVLGCGGTRLAATAGSITSEVVWNDLAVGNGATGGGVSTVFARPTWQTGVHADPMPGETAPADGRGVPDVSSLADPQTPYVVMGPAGRLAQVGGTSAAAPLWAALVSRLNQALGARVGFVNPLLYSRLHGTLRDITAGNNGGYEATTGWD
ncbi:MAG: S53 family peptidase, partial [Acidimicrobiales bacterium]